MAKVILTNPVITFQVYGGGPTYDFSDHIANVTLGTTHDLVEITKSGDLSKHRIAGLADNTVSFEFHQDFDVNSIEDIIGDNVGNLMNVTIKASTSGVSVLNPLWSFVAVISEWTPVNAGPGQLSTISVTWPINGDITKTTTP
jgi:hypothetical protein